MIDLGSFYGALPVPLQQVACCLEGWRVSSDRYGGAFSARLQELEERAFWPPDRLESFRSERFLEFVHSARERSPYWRGRLARAGWDGTLTGLAGLPVLDKAEVQANPEAFSAAVGRGRMRRVHTSGTTGGGLRFRSTQAALQEQWAVWWRYRRWHGIDPGTPCGFFGGRSVVPLEQRDPPYWRYDLPGRQILFSAYHTSPEHLAAWVGELRRSRPPWLHGYPSLLALLAAWMVDRGIDLGYRLRWITTGAENLLPQQAQLMQRAFGVRPRQHYGMAEAVANASECELGRLHVDEDFAFVEFLPSGDGVSHRVIGTNFTNPATPLLRYEVQDRVILGAGCSCGRPGRILERVDGRLEDYVILANGTRLGRLDHIFKDLVRIREAQIVQDRAGEVVFRIARARGYDRDDENRLRQEAQRRLGRDMRIELEYVDAIERTATGKLRFVISRAAGAALAGWSAGPREGRD